MFGLRSRSCVVVLAVFLVWVSILTTDAATYRVSGRHQGDFVRPSPDRIKLNIGPYAVRSESSQPAGDGSGLDPTPIPTSEAPIGGDFVDSGNAGGPADPNQDWQWMTDQAQQWLLDATQLGFAWQAGPPLYNSSVAVMDVDLTGLFAPASLTQGECNACWAYASTEHLQAVLVKQGYLSGYWPNILNPEPTPIFPNQPVYHRLSVQQVIDCSSSQGCDGGSVVDAWRWAVNGSDLWGGVVPWENYPSISGHPESQRCGPVLIDLTADAQRLCPPVYTPGAQVGWHVVPPCFDPICEGSLETEEAVADYMTQTGVPIVVYVDASQWSNATSGVIYSASACNSSGHASTAVGSHVVQIVGHGTDTPTGQRFWLIRNSWGTDWADGGHLRLEFGSNACGLMNYAIHADIPPPAPVTNNRSGANGGPQLATCNTQTGEPTGRLPKAQDSTPHKKKVLLADD